MKRALVIDCNYICHVSFHAIPEMTYDNLYTGVIFGLLKRVIELSKRFEPHNIAFAWDSKTSERKRIYPGYKRGRVELAEKFTEEEKFQMQQAYHQFDRLREEILPNLGFSNIFVQDGYEADDMIASVVNSNEEYTIVMVTSDKDMYQLISDRCMFYSPAMKKLITKTKFEEEWGFTPSLFGKARSISGCRTDQTLCLDGVGEKTAAKYLMGKLNKNTVAYKKIEGNKEITECNEYVIVLPMEGTVRCPLKPNSVSKDKFVSVCNDVGFRSLLKEATIKKWEDIVKE